MDDGSKDEEKPQCSGWRRAGGPWPKGRKEKEAAAITKFASVTFVHLFFESLYRNK